MIYSIKAFKCSKFYFHTAPQKYCFSAELESKTHSNTFEIIYYLSHIGVRNQKPGLPINVRLDPKGYNCEVTLYFIYYKCIYEEKAQMRWLQE